MKNTQLWNIIEKYKKELNALWYDTSDDNMENLINGFIKIANSMMTDEMEKMPNIDFLNFLNQLSPFKNVKIEFIKSDKKIISNLLDENSNTKNLTIKHAIKNINKNQIIDKLSKYIYENKINEFLKYFENENTIKYIVDKKITKKQIKEMLINENILEKFNKWDLTEKETQIIIELLNN